MKKLLLLLLIFTAGQVVGQDTPEAPPPGCDVPPVQGDPLLTHGIIYSRQPTWRIPFGTGDQWVQDASNWQTRTGVKRIHGLLTYQDIVYNKLSGSPTTVIHSCTQPGEECVAQEARVLLNGEDVVYSVCTGRSRKMKIWGGPQTTHDEMYCESAELWLYNIPTNKKRRLTTGHRDRMPHPIDNENIVFTSDRAGTIAPLSRSWNPVAKTGGNEYPDTAMNIHRCKITPTGCVDVKNISPQSVNALNPFVASNGRLYFVDWWGYLPRKDGTPANRWVIMSSTVDGADPVHAELGAHGSSTLKSAEYLTDWVNPLRRGEGSTVIRALRGLAEIETGYLDAVNYYRGNSLGACGMNFRWDMNIPGEGALRAADIGEAIKWSDKNIDFTGRYIPSDIMAMNPWGQDQDADPRFNKDGRAAGRACYPAPYPGPNSLLTHLRGWGYFSGSMNKYNSDWMGGEPLAKLQIDMVLTDKVTNPFNQSQIKCIAECDDKYNGVDAFPVATYMELHGQALPDAPKPFDGIDGDFGELHVVDITKGELRPAPGREDEKNRVTFQGNALDCAPECTEYLRITMVEHWNRSPDKAGFMNETILGDFKKETDGSVKATGIPCEQPFKISGLTADKETSATDSQPMALMRNPKTGQCEVRTCHGCHDGHSEERAALLGLKGTSQERFLNTTAGGANEPTERDLAGRLDRAGRLMIDDAGISIPIEERTP